MLIGYTRNVKKEKYRENHAEILSNKTTKIQSKKVKQARRHSMLKGRKANSLPN